MSKYLGSVESARQKLLSLEPVSVQEIADMLKLMVGADEAIETCRLQDARRFKHTECRRAREERFASVRGGQSLYLASEVMTPVERARAERTEFRTILSHLRRLRILRKGDGQRKLFRDGGLAEIFEQLSHAIEKDA